jgi:hypothetical protein
LEEHTKRWKIHDEAMVHRANEDAKMTPKNEYLGDSEECEGME